MLTEPLLQECQDKYINLPGQYPDLDHFYDTHRKTIWFDTEIDMAGDTRDWVTQLNEDEQFFIKHILAFFAASDGIVMENISINFAYEIKNPAARSFYALQLFIEDIHSRTYSKLIKSYVSDQAERDKLFNAIEEFPAIKKKAQWAIKWINSDCDFATRLFAFMIVEGLFFSGAFCSIFWLSERGIMPGLIVSNNYIARDEGLHVDFAAHLYNKYVSNKLSQDFINEIITEAIDIEKEFILEALPCSLLGMNAKLMSQYIEFVADKLLKQLNYESMFDGVKCPFEFMNRINLVNQADFFVLRPTEYTKSIDEKKSIDFNVEF
jgi:ribonucleoside-diphosphate reductase beta chain